MTSFMNSASCDDKFYTFQIVCDQVQVSGVYINGPDMYISREHCTMKCLCYKVFLMGVPSPQKKFSREQQSTQFPFKMLEYYGLFQIDTSTYKISKGIQQ